MNEEPTEPTDGTTDESTGQRTATEPASPPEADTEAPEPATWENVVYGEVEELAGHLLRSEEMVADGEERKEIAHEVREEYREEQGD